MITASDIIQALKLASESEKEEIANALIPIVEKTHAFEERVTEIVEKVLDITFEGKLAHSKFQPVQRIYEIETFVGTEGFNSTENEEDENIPSLADRIQTLEEKIDNVKVGASENPSVEIKLKSKTGKRAMALIKALMASKKGHLTRTQIRDVLSNEELGDARITEKSSNPRRVIIDAINEAKTICSKVIPDQKNYGRHEWRLRLES